MGNLNFVGQAIPANVANFLTPVRMALITRAVIEGVQFVQSVFQQLPDETPEQAIARRKKEAVDFACASYDLADSIFGFNDMVDAYVKYTLIPSLVDGIVVAFNHALWFDTTKPVNVGGQHAPSPPAGAAFLVGAQPKTPVPEPLTPEVAS